MSSFLEFDFLEGYTCSERGKDMHACICGKENNEILSRVEIKYVST